MSKLHFPKRIIAAAGLLILIAFLYLIAIYNPAYDSTPETLQVIQSALEKQQKIEQDLKAFYTAGAYSFAAPLVLQDPYRSAPLTALILFETPQPAQISVHVPGKTPEAAVDFSEADYQTHHEIHVYGLYADSLNRVTLQLHTQDGQTQQQEIDLQTEPLPPYLQKMDVALVRRAQYSPGFNFTALDHKEIFDIDGEVRWFSTQTTYQVFTPLKNGRFLFTYPGERNNILMEQDLLGKIYTIYNVKDGVHHDVVELPNGNLLLTSENSRSTMEEDYIFELDRQTGHILRFFDLKSILDPGRPKEIDSQPDDWFHLNSIDYDPSDSSILISGRFQSAVIKLSYPEMKIQWILGPHEGWSQKFQPYLLEPVGDGFEWQWSQHHATFYRVWPSSEGRVDVQLFDNGLFRSFDSENDLPPLESYSRVVHYRVDEKAMTVEQTWEYGKERGWSLFSNSLGSAYLLENGHIFGTWGSIARDAAGSPVLDTRDAVVEAVMIEVDPTDQQVVFEAVLPATENYRTLRGGLYAAYQAENSALVLPIQDTSENDWLDRSQMLSMDINNWLEQQISSGKKLLHDLFL